MSNSYPPKPSHISHESDKPLKNPFPEDPEAHGVDVVVPALGYQVPTGRQTPPGSPSHRLLDASTTSDPHTQYAPFTSDKIQESRQDRTRAALEKGWTPLPLRTYFWVPLVLVMLVAAITLEISLHYSNKNKGWHTFGVFSTEAGFMHYVYTLPPVGTAMVLVALWAWTDIEIKKMQPYVDLVHGDSPPQRSLLLDYTRSNNFIVWTQAAANKHYLVSLATLMVLLSLSFSPLSAALLTVRDTLINEPDMTMMNLGQIGLNQDAQFQDLTSFLTAAGFASASVHFNLAEPPFVHDVYTIAPFQLPSRDFATNGTVWANTTAIRSEPNCFASDSMAMSKLPDGWNNTATSQGCNSYWQADQSAASLFGIDVPVCGDGSTPPQFAPAVFWFFTYQPQVKAEAIFCYPNISIWDATVSIDLGTGNLTSVTALGPFVTGSSNFSSASANVTGAPLFGRAYNGMAFNVTNPNSFTTARQNAVQLMLPAAVFQAAETSAQGLVNTFESNAFQQLSSDTYTTYLKLIAKTVYFMPAQLPMTVQVQTVRKRLWLSDPAVHLLAVALFLLSFFGTIINLLHRADRADLKLAHEPGTIASAVSIGAHTNMADLLTGEHQKDDDLRDALKNRKFRIDRKTMKIVMEGEEGFEYAVTPDPRRSAFFNSGEAGKRFSAPPPTRGETM